MALNDMPELHDVFKKLMAEKESLVKKAKPFRDRYDQLQAKMDAIKDEMAVVAEKFKPIERPRLAEIDEKLSAIARVTGGKFLNS